MIQRLGCILKFSTSIHSDQILSTLFFPEILIRGELEFQKETTPTTAIRLIAVSKNEGHIFFRRRSWATTSNWAMMSLEVVRSQHTTQWQVVKITTTWKIAGAWKVYRGPRLWSSIIFLNDTEHLRPTTQTNRLWGIRKKRRATKTFPLSVKKIRRAESRNPNRQRLTIWGSQLAGWITVTFPPNLKHWICFVLEEARCHPHWIRRSFH